MLPLRPLRICHSAEVDPSLGHDSEIKIPGVLWFGNVELLVNNPIELGPFGLLPERGLVCHDPLFLCWNLLTGSPVCAHLRQDFGPQ